MERSTNGRAKWCNNRVNRVSWHRNSVCSFVYMVLYKKQRDVLCYALEYNYY